MITSDEFSHYISSCNEKHTWIEILYQEFPGCFFFEAKKVDQLKKYQPVKLINQMRLSMIFAFYLDDFIL